MKSKDWRPIVGFQTTSQSAQVFFATGWWGHLFLSFAFAPFDFQVLSLQAAFCITVGVCDGIRSGVAGLARQLPFRLLSISRN
jgi:hypothetical protein